MLAWILIAGTITGFSLVYSLIGRMTDVYRLPVLDQFATARGYLISDGERWFHVMLWDGRKMIAGRQAPIEQSVDRGFWIMDITNVDGQSPEKFHAYPPLDLIDVYSLRFGPLSEEVKKLGPKWIGP